MLTASTTTTSMITNAELQAADLTTLLGAHFIAPNAIEQENDHCTRFTLKQMADKIRREIERR